MMKLIMHRSLGGEFKEQEKIFFYGFSKVASKNPRKKEIRRKRPGPTDDSFQGVTPFMWMPAATSLSYGQMQDNKLHICILLPSNPMSVSDGACGMKNFFSHSDIQEYHDLTREPVTGHFFIPFLLWLPAVYAKACVPAQ